MVEYSIELRGGPEDGHETDLMVFGCDGVVTEEYPEAVYSSRAVRTTICLPVALHGWEADAIRQAFWVYHRTDQTNERGRRVYTIARPGGVTV
jgi:hypothetical protein